MNELVLPKPVDIEHPIRGCVSDLVKVGMSRVRGGSVIGSLLGKTVQVRYLEDRTEKLFFKVRDGEVVDKMRRVYDVDSVGDFRSGLYVFGFCYWPKPGFEGERYFFKLPRDPQYVTSELCEGLSKEYDPSDIRRIITSLSNASQAREVDFEHQFELHVMRFANENPPRP